MKVLSLFDGMACGMLAMQAACVPVDRYVAFEIDKYAVQTSSHNFPRIEHRGDVFKADFTEFRGFDFLVGGSPCTYWSIAQKNNRETEASGMGWELFQQYVRALHEAQPTYFIYENNKSMSNAIRESISSAFGFEPIWINSALVSAQTRQRLYWVGKRNPDGTYSRVAVDQPEDRGLLVRDILESRADLLLEEQLYRIANMKEDQAEEGLIRLGDIGSTAQAHRVYSCAGKSVTINAGGGGQGGKTGLYLIPCEFEALSSEYYHGDDATAVFGKIACKNTSNNNGQPAQGTRIYRTENKSVCLSADPRNYVITRVDGRFFDQRGRVIPVYEVLGGYINIEGSLYSINLPDGFYVIRKLTVTECKRLQTVPDWYTFPVSNAQAYKMLGNGWTVEVIKHLILSALIDPDDSWML